MIASVLSRTIRRTCISNASRQLASTCSGFRNKSIPKDASRRSCWKCGSKICQGCTLFCASPTCGAIQGLEKDGCNYFCLFGIEGTFDLDDAHLEATFKNLQKQLHPDKFAMKSIEERERSSYNSSIVNQAYQVVMLMLIVILILNWCWCWL